MKNPFSLRFMDSWHLWVVIAFGIPLVAYAFHRLACDYWGGNYENDFEPYYEAARRLHQGDLLYVRDQGFIYPPAAVLMFLPCLALTRHAAYVFFSAFSYLPLLLAVVVMGALWRRSGRSTTLLEKAAVFVCALGVAPSFDNAAWGQVNTIVLLSCVLYFWLLASGRPLWAGLALSVGAWIKIYPAFMLVCLLFEPQRWRAMAGFIIGGVLVPMAASVVVPLHFYREYFFSVLPGFVQMAKPRVMNQSLIGLLTRVSLGPVDVSLNTGSPLAAWMNWTNRLVFLAVSSLMLWFGVRFPRLRAIILPACILSLIPLFSPLGWSYVYVLSLPLMFIALLMAQEKSFIMRMLLLMAIVAMAVPIHHIIPGAAQLPVLVQHMVYTRYFFATVLMGVVVVAHAVDQNEQTER